MRQILSVFLLFSVLISSTGFTLAKHFCGEMLAHVTLNEAKSCCDNPQEDMPDDCCHDEFEQLLLDDSQLDHQKLQIHLLTFFTVSVLTSFLSFSPEVAVSTPWAAFPSPPLPGTPVYLRVQSFLI